MPLKKVSKQQYDALYREALFILNKLCQHKKNTDHEDAAHLTLEIYFTMKSDSKNAFSLEQAAAKALLEDPCIKKKRLPLDYEKSSHEANDVLSQREAQRDLDRIYLLVKDDLSLEEKYIFCMLLKDVPASAIIEHLDLTEADFITFKDSLIGKLRDAATSSSTHKIPASQNRDLCVGRLKTKVVRN